MTDLLLRRSALLDATDTPVAYRLTHNGSDARGLVRLLGTTKVDVVSRGLPVLATVSSDELSDLLTLAGGHPLWLRPAEDELDDVAVARWHDLPPNVTVVVGDPVDAPGHAAIGDVATFVHVDAEHLDVHEVTARRQQLLSPRLLVTGVHRVDLAARCRALGAELLGGQYLNDVTHDATRVVEGDRLTLLRLMAELQTSNVAPRTVTELVEQSPSVSFELLRWVNSAWIGLKHEVDDLSRAVGLLGPGRVRQVVSLLLARELSDRPDELSRGALVRARMCEQVGAAMGDVRPGYYVTGLFSMLDALLEIPLDTVVAQLPLTEEVQGALLHHDGRLGRVLQATKLYENAIFDDEALASFDATVLSAAYLDALVYADGVLGAVAAA